MALTAKKSAGKSAPVGSGSTGAADAAIAAIYDQLAGQLGSGAGVTGMNFDRARQLVGSAYDQGGYLAQRAQSATMGGLNGQFDRLGIGAAMPGASQGLRDEYAGSLQAAAARRTNAMDTMGQQQVGYEMAGRMGIDNSRREGAQQRADSVTKIQQALLAMQAAQATAQGQNQLASIQGKTSLESLRLQMQMAEQERQAASQGDPLDLLRADNMNLDGMLKKAQLEKLMNPGMEDIKGDGQQALEQFLAQNAGQVSPALLNRFNALKSDAFTNAAKPSDLGYRQDPYDLAMSELMTNQNYGGGERQRRLLEQMLQTYFG